MNHTQLTIKQIELVKSAIGDMLENKTNLSESSKEAEQNLKALLDNAGATDEDLQAIMNYFEDVQTELDSEKHIGSW